MKSFYTQQCLWLSVLLCKTQCMHKPLQLTRDVLTKYNKPSMGVVLFFYLCYFFSVFLTEKNMKNLEKFFSAQISNAYISKTHTQTHLYFFLTLFYLKRFHNPLKSSKIARRMRTNKRKTHTCKVKYRKQTNNTYSNPVLCINE